MQFALGLTYDGAGFHGWQRQRQVVTVQSELEKALSRIANQPTTVAVAGRTDRGVHATGQVASFHTRVERSVEVWQRGLNGLTPASIAISWVCPVASEFHPRYSALARRYTYLFYDAPAPQPLLANRVWQTAALDADAMHRAAQYLLGEHDFTAVRAAGCQSLTPVRRIDQCVVRREGHYVMLEIQANAFLLHMVRNIASLLVEVGLGVRPSSIDEFLHARDRSQLGVTAPPQGLYFTAVHYPEKILEVPADQSELDVADSAASMQFIPSSAFQGAR